MMNKKALMLCIGVSCALHAAEEQGRRSRPSGNGIVSQEVINNSLLQAAANNDGKLVHGLLCGDFGLQADVNAHGGEGGTALMSAAWKGNEAMVRELLDAGADVNAVNDKGGTALLVAAAFGRTAVASRLLLQELATPPTEEAINMLEGRAKKILTDLMPEYFRQLAARSVATAQVLDRQKMPKALTMFTLEQTFGSYIRHASIEQAVSEVLKEELDPQ